MGFPKVFDNTMISAYRACPKKFWWRHQQMLQKGEVSIHLSSGAAFAKGLEVTRKCYFNRGMSFQDALDRGTAALIAEYGHVEPHPKYANKSWDRFVSALSYYFEVWPIDKGLTPINVGNKHAIEWNFSVPIPNVRNPDTNEPILYCGRFDMAGVHETGVKLGEDDKTTSQLGQSWYDRWRLANQILGYMWGSREHSLNLAGFNVRGISLLKHSHGHAETTIFINHWQIERFVENLVATVRKIINDYNFKTWELNMSHSCSAFGGCDYLPLCESPEPNDWIPIHYTENEWNPLASRD